MIIRESLYDDCVARIRDEIASGIRGTSRTVPNRSLQKTHDSMREFNDGTHGSFVSAVVKLMLVPAPSSTGGISGYREGGGVRHSIEFQKRRASSSSRLRHSSSAK